MENYLYRNTAQVLSHSLELFFKSYHNKRALSVNSDASRLYNDFIVKSFSVARNQRYSISQLSDTLKRNDISRSDIHYLLIRYIDGMYLLSVAYNNNSEEFWP